MESRIASYSAAVADQEDWCRDTPPATLSVSASLSFVSFRLRRFAAIYRASWGRKRRLCCAYREGSGGRLDSIVAEDWCHARFWAAINVSDIEKHTWAGPKATWQQCDNAGSAPDTRYYPPALGGLTLRAAPAYDLNRCKEERVK
jgi:hypothetical protein